MLELIMETGTALGFESPASWSFPFPPLCSIQHWDCIPFNYEVCAYVWRRITEIIPKITPSWTVALMQDLSWQGGELVIYSSSNYKTPYTFPSPGWLHKWSAPRDGIQSWEEPWLQQQCEYRNTETGTRLLLQAPRGKLGLQLWHPCAKVLVVQTC